MSVYYYYYYYYYGSDNKTGVCMIPISLADGCELLAYF